MRMRLSLFLELSLSVLLHYNILIKITGIDQFRWSYRFISIRIRVQQIY